VRLFIEFCFNKQFFKIIFAFTFWMFKVVSISVSI
jgi:hypothetical protein